MGNYNYKGHESFAVAIKASSHSSGSYLQTDIYLSVFTWNIL